MGSARPAVAKDLPVFRAPEGLGLRSSPLRLDPKGAAALAFVSGAAPTSRLPGHRRVLATAEVLSTLGVAAGRHALPLSFGRSFELGGLVLEARPSGHRPGAAQLRILTNAGLEVCYAPGLCPSPGRTVPAADVVACDVLVLEARRAEATPSLPTREASLERVLAFVDETLGAGEIPAVVTASPSAPAEVLALLADHDRPARIHRRLRRLLAATGRLPRGTGGFPARVAPGETVVLPTGIEPPAGARVLTLGAVAAAGPSVPYADDASDPDLVAHAKDTGARRVVTFGPGAERVADLLAAAGVAAAALAAAEQLALL